MWLLSHSKAHHFTVLQVQMFSQKGAEQIHSIYAHVKMIIGFVGDACGVCQQRMKLTIHRTTVVLCSKMNMLVYD